MPPTILVEAPEVNLLETFSYPEAARIFVVQGGEGQAHTIYYDTSDPGTDLGALVPNGSIVIPESGVEIYIKIGTWGQNDGTWVTFTGT